MVSKLCMVLASLAVVTLAQRSPYAGRGVGYPVIRPETTTQSADNLGNRFGDEDASSTTTMRLPIEALGDRDLIDRLSKLPVDKQPFWFINWKILEQHRKEPHTYDQKPSSFADPSLLGFNFQQWI